MKTLAQFRDAALGAGALGALAYFIADAFDLPLPANRRWQAARPTEPVEPIADYGWVYNAGTGQRVRPATQEERDACTRARQARGGEGFFTYIGGPPKLVVDGDPEYGAASLTAYSGSAYFVDRFSDPSYDDREPRHVPVDPPANVTLTNQPTTDDDAAWGHAEVAAQ